MAGIIYFKKKTKNKEDEGRERGKRRKEKKGEGRERGEGGEEREGREKGRQGSQT